MTIFCNSQILIFIYNQKHTLTQKTPILIMLSINNKSTCKRLVKNKKLLFSFIKKN